MRKSPAPSATSLGVILHELLAGRRSFDGVPASVPASAPGSNTRPPANTNHNLNFFPAFREVDFEIDARPSPEYKDMRNDKLMAPPRNPVTADQIRPGDPYEISEGRLIEVMPTGRRGARGNVVGGMVLDSDPTAAPVGADAGVSPRPNMLRAPDLAVGGLEADEPGWATQAPMLAVEYADTGQDEAELQKKIAELLDAGTRWVWVVRLKGKRRVEVYEAPMKGAPKEGAEPSGPTSSVPSGVRPRVRPARVAWPGEHLHAPGALRNPVLVESLYDREAAHEAVLRNLLQRKGFDSLEAVHEKGLEKGLRRTVRDLCEVLGIPLSADHEAAIETMTAAQLEAVCARLKRDRCWPEPDSTA